MPEKPREPEDVSFEIGASYLPIINTGLPRALDGAEAQVFACLRANAGNIASAEATFHVTRLAIAGAVAWEMLQNPHRQSPRTAGYGKVHLLKLTWEPWNWDDTVAKQVEDRGYLPTQSLEQRKIILSTPDGAIRYIAAIMAAIADITARLGFGNVRDNPVVLTNAYNSRDLKGWEAHLLSKPKGSGWASGNRMDTWVSSNLNFLTAAVGSPDPQKVPQ